MKSWIRTTWALLAVFAAVPLAAQQATNRDAPANQQAPAAAGGVQEGVALHGNWVLDVRDPDGTLVRHAEFKNALSTFGKDALAAMLTGQPVTDWYVVFSGHPFATPFVPLCVSSDCTVLRNNGQVMNFRNSMFVFQVGDWFTSLSVASQGSNVVLTGSFTVGAVGGGLIYTASTFVASQTSNGSNFTLATLPTPLPVAQGQIVQFTYTLSFS